MKKTIYVTAVGLVLVLSGCAQQPPKEQKPITGETIKTYSVDEFVESGFKEQKKVRIKIGSITCYNNSCGVEGGAKGKWGIAMQIDDYTPFYPYAGKAVDMTIEAEPACLINVEQCNTIKNVSIVETPKN